MRKNARARYFQRTLYERRPGFMHSVVYNNKKILGRIVSFHLLSLRETRAVTSGSGPSSDNPSCSGLSRCFPEVASSSALEPLRARSKA